MATVSGTSTRTWQRVVGYGNLTVAQLEIVIPSLKTAPPNRIGYGFILARDINVGQLARVLLRGPIYSPGIFYTFTNLYGFSNVQYAWEINWNTPGLGWTVTFV